MPSSSKPSSTLLPPTLKPLKLNSSGLGQSTNNAEKAAPVSSKLQTPKLSFSLGSDSNNSAKANPIATPSSKLNTKLQTPKLSFSLGEPTAKVAAKPTAWSPEKTPLVLVQREYETHDSMSFTFASADHQLFDFKPGQFVTLAVNIDDKTHYRAYSISSIPQQKQLRLTIKRVPDGLVSNWLVDNLNVGDTLSALNIAGQFNSTDCTHKSKLLFISAGCGITPVMSMAKTMLAADNSDVDIEFLHCARDKDNVIFHDEMSEMAVQHTQFNVQLLLENSTGFSAQSELAHQTGMVNTEVVQTLYPDLDQRTIFLCGPVGFMKAVQAIAEQSGFDMAHFFQESFTPAADNAQQDALSTVNNAAETDLATNVMLHVPDFSVAAEVKQGTSLLDALEKHNVPVIGACRAGVCGSCKCKVTSGTVTSTSTETLTAAEIDQGFVLACSSTVQGDVAVALS
ncbi:hybrid-cluster NAD(P)-dependent oxidoreductase [Photobacterium sp.]|uniref:hybrid-cluster NAD(P)-dependent oxidoreductase n=1 Tax=Photobacterium sp. TaxID=660 RepID=UPI00299E0DC2|nr:hybrid-cluster NAD(P)-dependent oxidoreductase [Photobacterium sp.]MDX1303758.1 hybrid-cluster NAD(P)-dependent oxidoreductase [Photobacterium sp.]